MSLAPHQVAAGKRLRMLGSSWDKVARTLNTTSDIARRAIQPEYGRRRAENVAAWKARQPKGPSERRVHFTESPHAVRNPEYDPRRDDAMQFESAAAILLGDPPIGRRALDEKTRAEAS